MKKNYDQCDAILKDGESICPIKDKCARYFEDIDKTTTNHLAFGPYKIDRKHCGNFEPYELDIINLLSHED
jgi:hypothetical protein